jgi:hypothetical protein
MPRFIRVKNLFPAPVRSLQLLSGPLLFLLLRQLQPFAGLNAPGHALLGVALWMAVWWLTEAAERNAQTRVPLQPVAAALISLLCYFLLPLLLNV